MKHSFSFDCNFILQCLPIFKILTPHITQTNTHTNTHNNTIQRHTTASPNSSTPTPKQPESKKVPSKESIPTPSQTYGFSKCTIAWRSRTSPPSGKNPPRSFRIFLRGSRKWKATEGIASRRSWSCIRTGRIKCFKRFRTSWNPYWSN